MAKPNPDDLCPACIAYLAHYPLMAEDWECEHGGDEQAFMLAMADAIHGPVPVGEFIDPGWRAAQFLDDAEVALDCGHAPYAFQLGYNVGEWSFLALVNNEHLIGTRNDEGAELEFIVNLGWLGIESQGSSAVGGEL